MVELGGRRALALAAGAVAAFVFWLVQAGQRDTEAVVAARRSTPPDSIRATSLERVEEASPRREVAPIRTDREQVEEAPAPERLEGDFVRIRGLVMAPTGFPAAGVWIEFADVGDWTAIDGTFTLTLERLPRVLPPGVDANARVAPHYALTASCNDFPTITEVDFGLRILTAYPADPPPLRLELQELQSIAGTVVDEAGRPVVGWTVFASPTDIAERLKLSRIVPGSVKVVRGLVDIGNEARTDEQGHFHIPDLLPLPHHVFAMDADGTRLARVENVRAGTRDLVVRAGEVVMVPSEKTPLKTFRGSARKLDGSPVAGAKIAIDFPEFSGVEVATTDMAGRFEFDVPLSRTKAWISCAGLQAMPAEIGPETTTMEFVLANTRPLVLTSKREFPAGTVLFLLNTYGQRTQVETGHQTDSEWELAPLLGRVLHVGEDASNLVLAGHEGEELLRIPLTLSATETTSLSL